jgi:hypothetical protein
MSGHDRGIAQQLFLDLFRGRQSGDGRTVVTVLWFWCCLVSATVIGGAMSSHGIKNSSHRFTSYVVLERRRRSIRAEGFGFVSYAEGVG